MNIRDELNGWELQSVYREPNQAGNPGNNILITFRKSLGGSWVEITLWGDATELSDLLDEWITT